MCINILGGFTEPNSISARAVAAVPAGKRFDSVNPPKNTRGYQTMCGAGFRVPGIVNYEVSFGLAPRNGELSPSDPKTQEFLNLRSGPRTRDSRFELPAKFVVGRSKLGVPTHIYPEIKGH